MEFIGILVNVQFFLKTHLTAFLLVGKFAESQEREYRIKQKWKRLDILSCRDTRSYFVSFKRFQDSVQHTRGLPSIS